MDLALVKFLSSLGVQYILVCLIFISVTLRLNLLFRNDVLYMMEFYLLVQLLCECWFYVINIIQNKFLNQNLIIVPLTDREHITASLHAFLSFLIIRSFILTVLWTFREKFVYLLLLIVFELHIKIWWWSLLANRKTVYSEGKIQLSSKNKLLIKIINKFIKGKNCGSYWFNKSIDHSGSVKMRRYFRKCCVNQWLMKNGTKINFLYSFIVKKDFVNIFRRLRFIIMLQFVYRIWLKTTKNISYIKRFNVTWIHCKILFWFCWRNSSIKFIFICGKPLIHYPFTH